MDSVQPVKLLCVARQRWASTWNFYFFFLLFFFPDRQFTKWGNRFPPFHRLWVSKRWMSMDLASLRQRHKTKQNYWGTFDMVFWLINSRLCSVWYLEGRGRGRARPCYREVSWHSMPQQIFCFDGTPSLTHSFENLYKSSVYWLIASYLASKNQSIYPYPYLSPNTFPCPTNIEW